MATTQDYINQLKIDKQNLVTMLNNMGVEASNSETFTSLTPKVGKIVTDPILQDKSIEITENGTTTIAADQGYDGLNNVEITTNVSTGGEGETTGNGLIVNQYDSNGFPTDVTVNGLTVSTAHQYLFGTYSTSSTLSIIGRYLKKLTLNNISGIMPARLCNNISTLEEFILQNSSVTAIGEYSFYGCSNLTKVDLSNSTITTLDGYAFRNCASLSTIKLPKTVKAIGTACFGGCTSLVSFALDNSTSIGFSTTSGSSGQFNGCTSLKGVWLGNVSNMTAYPFNGCTGLKKIFINKTRATVEAFGGYSSAFSNNAVTTDVIVCNDDEGFITKEEFDAIDWSTYTE